MWHVLTHTYTYTYTLMHGKWCCICRHHLQTPFGPVALIEGSEWESKNQVLS